MSSLLQHLESKKWKAPRKDRFKGCTFEISTEFLPHIKKFSDFYKASLPNLIERTQENLKALEKEWEEYKQILEEEKYDKLEEVSFGELTELVRDIDRLKVKLSEFERIEKFINDLSTLEKAGDEVKLVRHTTKPVVKVLKDIVFELTEIPKTEAAIRKAQPRINKHEKSIVLLDQLLTKNGVIVNGTLKIIP